MELIKAENRKGTLIIILLLVLVLMGVGLFNAGPIEEQRIQKTAVIVQTDEALNDMKNGQLRIRINSAVQIQADTMQNLAFANLNKNRKLQCKIKVNDVYVYDSGFVETGDVVQADVIDTTALKEGKNTATAEIYNYNMNQELIGQTNTVIDLYLND